MSVCNGFTINGLMHSLPFWHVLLIMPSQWRSRTERTENDGRQENKSRAWP